MIRFDINSKKARISKDRKLTWVLALNNITETDIRIVE